MMDKKPSKWFRVLKFEENAVSSLKNEMRTESAKPGKSPRGTRGSRAPERARSPDPQASIKNTTTNQDRKSTRTVGKKPVKKIILNQRSNTRTGELNRIYSSTNYPELNSARDAHQVGDKTKKTKKKAKGKRKKSYLPDHFRRYEDTVTYKCETNKSPRRTRNEPPRYEQKRITPSMYYLSAGDSIERGISKAPRKPKVSDESCDCLPAEITCPNASHYKDSLSSHNSRKCTEDCTIWRAGEGKNLPICHCASLNINLNRHTARRYCICTTNKSSMPIYPTSTMHTTTYVDGQTSGFLHNNASNNCQTLHKNSMFEQSAQPSNLLPNMCSITNTADIRCNSRALDNSSSKNVTIKSPRSNTNSWSSHELISYNYSARKSDLVRSNPSCQCRMNGTCKCPSSNLTSKGRNSLTAGKVAQCLVIPTVGTVTEKQKLRVSAHPDCPALRSASQNTQCSAITVPSCSSNLKAAYHIARTAIMGTGDAPPTSPACVSVQTGGSPASLKLGHSVSCPVNDENNCYLLLRCVSEMPKYITKNPKISRSKASSAPPCNAVKTEHETGCVRPRCNISCGSFRVKMTLDRDSSPISELVNGVRMRRKPCHRSCFKMKKLFFFPKCGKNVEPDICGSRKSLHSVAAATSVPIISPDAEIGCLNNSCLAGPRRVYALFEPIFTRSTCYFYYIIYVISMIICSPFVAIIYFFRVLTSPIRRTGRYFDEICPTCIPPRPCPHTLISIFKSRQWFDKPKVCSSSTRVVCELPCETSDAKCKKKKPQGVINQKCTSRQAQECNKHRKNRQFQTYYSEIPSKCSWTNHRSRKDNIISQCSCSKPQPCEKIISSKSPSCEDKCCKPPVQRNKRSICWKPLNDQIPPSKCSQPPSNRNQGSPRQSSSRPCIIKRRPCKTKMCKNRMCKWKNVFSKLRCKLRKSKRRLIEFWEKHQPREPSRQDCLDLTGPYDTLPPPAFYLYDPELYKKSFIRAKPKPMDSFYYYCTYIIAATFWCPLGLCLYFTYKAFGKC